MHYKDILAYYELAYFMKDYIDKNTIIVCIGTDRCIGDCLGPLVGTILHHKKFPLPVYGSVSEPIHALNLEKRIQEINTLHPKANIIGIDACLGDGDCIEKFKEEIIPFTPKV